MTNLLVIKSTSIADLQHSVHNSSPSRGKICTTIRADRMSRNSKLAVEARIVIWGQKGLISGCFFGRLDGVENLIEIITGGEEFRGNDLVDTDFIV